MEIAVYSIVLVLGLLVLNWFLNTFIGAGFEFLKVGVWIHDRLIGVEPGQTGYTWSRLIFIFVVLPLGAYGIYSLITSVM